MKATASNALRRAGLAAMLSGILYVVIQATHPADTLSSVTTAQWATVHYLSLAMSFLGLLGVAGLYARQAEQAGWLGLAGYLLFSVFYAFALGFQFVEAFISPLLATQAPQFVEGLLGIVNGHATETNLGALPAVWVGNRGVLFARRRAVRRRDVPRGRPAALGSRSACRRDPVAYPRVVAGPAPVRPDLRGAGWVGSGLAGICAVV